MAIKLPNNFKNDVQGRDTSLFPVVVIGNWDYDSYDGANWDDWIISSLLLSTNSFSFTKNISGSTITANCLPVLKSLPSLSESLDIDNRKYKINSINLDISNLPFEGKRISERISEQFGSSINTECRVYWWSPTTDWIEPLDISGSDPPETSAMQIFTGTIHKYDHSDESVRITVEDLSQTKLHRPIPVEDIGAGNEVPDKYKNRPYPMVYGDVDRSPCLISNVNNGEDKIDVEFLCDNSNKSTFVGETKKIGTLSFFEDGYVDILENIKDDLSAGDNLYEAGLQYTRDRNRLTLERARFKDPQDQTYYSTLGEKVAYCRKIIYPISASFLGYEDSFSVGNYLLGITTYYGFDDDGVILTDVIGGSALNLIGNNVDTIDISGHNHGFNIAEEGDSQSNIEIRPTVITTVFESLSADRITGTAFFLIGSFTATNDSYGTELVYGDTGLTITIGVKDGDDNLSGRGIHIYQTGGDSEAVYQFVNAITSSRTFYNQEETPDYKVILKKDDHFSPKFTIQGINLAEGWVGTISEAWVDSTINIANFGFIAKFWVEDLFNKDFFCHAYGRTWGDTETISVSFQQIVGSIMYTELGQELPDIVASDYEDWRFDFTISERINSKKLIEDFAKASPYLPHFDNLGNFKISQIAQTGGVLSDLDGNEIIKDEDVIDFKFSRTPIEKVFTKIILKYNWSYGREEFDSSIEVNVDDTFGGDYNHAYYGFPNDYSESTLLDEERGKFIRKPETAEKLAKWMVYWHSNQHLKMKIKLPLKYMNLQIGDIVKFDKLVGGIAPYGINYTTTTMYGDVAFNGQPYYPTFIISGTKKTLQHCEIDVIQLHNCEDCVPEREQKSGEGGKEGDEEGNGGKVSGYDCAGICNGDAVLDACGVCGGTETDLINCPCPGTVIDNYTGIDSGMPGCNPPNCDFVLDCNGNCIDFPSEAIQIDPCGICGGDGTTCTGCAEWGALDYDPDSNCPGCNCLFPMLLVNGQEGITCCETEGEANYCNDLLVEAGWDPNSSWYQEHPELIINTVGLGGQTNDQGQTGALVTARAAFEANGGMDVYNLIGHEAWMAGGEGSNRPILYTTDISACQVGNATEVYIEGGFSLNYSTGSNWNNNNINGILLRNNLFGEAHDSLVGLENYHISMPRVGDYILGAFYPIQPITEFRLNYYFCDGWDYQNLDCDWTSTPWNWDSGAMNNPMRSIFVSKCLTESCHESEFDNLIWSEDMIPIDGFWNSWDLTAEIPWYDSITDAEWFNSDYTGGGEVKFLVQIITWEDYPLQQANDFVNWGRMKFFITLDLTDHCVLGDIAGDGIIGSDSDWELLLWALGQPQDPGIQYLCAADMNCSGLVDQTDFILMQHCYNNMADEGFDNCFDYLASAYPEYAGCSTPEDVYGCTDPAACNYDGTATADDGSCDYGSTCWDGSVECDSSNCPELVPCSETTCGELLNMGWPCWLIENNLGHDCSSCIAEGVDCSEVEATYGCMDPEACNYDSYANVDNHTCEYNVDCNGICGGSYEIDECGVCLFIHSPHWNSTCADCLGVPNGDAVIDECGVCNGDGMTFVCWDGSMACNESGCPADPGGGTGPPQKPVGTLIR